MGVATFSQARADTKVGGGAMSIWQSTSRKKRLTILTILLIFVVNIGALLVDGFNKSRVVGSITLSPTEYAPLDREYAEQLSAFWLHIGTVDDRYKCINCARLSQVERAFYQKLLTQECNSAQKHYAHPWVLLETNGASYHDYLARFSTEKSVESYGIREGADSKIFAVAISFDKAELDKTMEQRRSLANSSSAEWISIRGSLSLNEYYCQSVIDYVERRTDESPQVYIQFSGLKKLHWPDKIESFDRGAVLNLGRADRFFLTPITE